MAAASSRSATANVTCQWSAPVAGGRDPGDRVLEAGRRGHRLLTGADPGVDGRLEMVAVAGAAQHRREAHVLDLPAEQRRVEAAGEVRLGVRRSLKFHVPGSLTACAPRRRLACQSRKRAPRGSAQIA